MEWPTLPGEVPECRDLCAESAPIYKALKESGYLRGSDIDGVIGLGPVQDPHIFSGNFLSMLKEQDSLEYEMFALNFNPLDKGPGNISFGMYDTKKYAQDELYYHKNTVSDYWSFRVDQVGTQITTSGILEAQGIGKGSMDAIIVSDNSISVPTQVHQEFANYFKTQYSCNLS